MASVDRSIKIVACYGHFMSHFNMLVFPAILLPLSQEFNIEMMKTLNLSFLMYLLFGVTAFPWGMAADRFGPKRLLLLFHLGAGGSALFAAFTVGDNFFFMISLAGIGFFSGIYHPAGLGWIAKEVKNTSRAMALNGIFGNLGLACAPIISGVVYHFFGVSSLYSLVAILNVCGIFFLIPTPDKNTKKTPKKFESEKGENFILPFCVLLICMTLGGIVYRGMSVTMPAYFEYKSIEVYQIFSQISIWFESPNITATLLTSVIYFIGMGGQYLGGKVGEAHDLRWSFCLFHLITIPAAMGMALMSDWPLFLFTMTHSFFLLGMQPIENTLVARLTPPKFHSSAYGLKFIFTFGFGAFSIKVVEFVKNNWGMEAIFSTMALVSTLLCCFIFLLILVTKNIASLHNNA